MQESIRSMSNRLFEIFCVISNLLFHLFWIDFHDLVELLLCDAASLPVEIFTMRNETERALVGLCCAFNTDSHPSQNASILAIAWPHEAAIGVLAEPADVEDVRKLDVVLRVRFEVAVEVVAHVITAEWKHSKRITT